MPLVQDMAIHAGATGRLVSVPVAADTAIFLGAIVAVDASGHAVPAADTAGLRVIGVAQAQVDNRGGAQGGRRVNVHKGVFGLPNSTANAVTQADVGRVVYVEDDGTVARTGGANNIQAGVVDELDDRRGLVYVYFA